MTTKLPSDKHLNDLSSLPFSSKLGFAASCCQRQLPNYYFSTKIGLSRDIDAITQAMNLIWDSFLENHTQQRASVEIFNNIINQYDLLGNHHPIWASAADSFFRALIYTLEMVVENTAKENAIVVGKISLDCIFEYVLNTTSSLSQEPVKRTADYYQWIYQTPIYLSELNKQRSDIRMLQHSMNAKNEIMNELVKDADYIGIHPGKRGF